jgi:hypothetical protein
MREGRFGLVERARDNCGAAELRDLERRRDGGGSLENEGNGTRTALAGDPEESVDRGAVDEHHAVEVEDDRAVAARELVQASSQVVGVREVELSAQHDDGEIRLAGLHKLQLVRCHRTQTIFRRTGLVLADSGYVEVT